MNFGIVNKKLSPYRATTNANWAKGKPTQVVLPLAIKDALTGQIFYVWFTIGVNIKSKISISKSDLAIFFFITTDLDAIMQKLMFFWD